MTLNTKQKRNLQSKIVLARAEVFDRFKDEYLIGGYPAARRGLEFNDIENIAKGFPYLDLIFPQDFVNEAQKLLSLMPELFCIAKTRDINEQVWNNWPYELIDNNLETYVSYFKECATFEKKLYKFITKSTESKK